MKKTAKTPQLLKTEVSLLLIGDDGASKSNLYDYLELPEEETVQEIGIQIAKWGDNKFAEIYDFPLDKMVRNALTIYTQILQPTLILYFLKNDATERDINEWVKVLKINLPHSRLLFVSDAASYLEREKIITRVGLQFEANVLEHICFAALEPMALQRSLSNIENAGVKISTAVCLKPSFWQKVEQKWHKTSLKVRRLIRSLFCRKDPSSVV